MNVKMGLTSQSEYSRGVESNLKIKFIWTRDFYRKTRYSESPGVCFQCTTQKCILNGHRYKNERGMYSCISNSAGYKESL